MTDERRMAPNPKRWPRSTAIGYVVIGAARNVSAIKEEI